MSGFPQALEFVLSPEIEGGVSDHPDDRGGLTNHGVTQETYNDWRTDHGLPERPVTEITEDEISAVYHEKYWVEAECDRWWWPLSLAVFDAAVQHGPPRAIRLLQEAAGAKVDGDVGPETIGKVAEMDRDLLLHELMWNRLEYYGRIVQDDESQAVFLLGWIQRMKNLDERLK